MLITELNPVLSNIVPVSQIHGKYNKLPLRVAARVVAWIAPRFYIPSRALALDPEDVIADEKDR